MRKCILNVTDREFDKILQLNHDALAWNNRDRELLEKLETLLGREVIEEIRDHDECRMKKHTSLDAISRVEEDTEDLVLTATDFRWFAL